MSSCLAVGQLVYTAICYDHGGMIDDGTLFRFSETEFQLCCQEPQYSWLHDVAWGFDVTIEDQSDTIAGLALQGPTSFALLKEAGFDGVENLKPFGIMDVEPGLKISRTGFTGDLGYELWVDASKADALWERLWPAGRNYGLRPIGSDALDMARIEAGFIAARVDFQPIHGAQRPSRGAAGARAATTRRWPRTALRRWPLPPPRGR